MQKVKLPVVEPRYKRLGTCLECGECATHKQCKPARVPELRKYGGIRHTADGFDCALPVTIDSHSVCSFGCVYCFSDNLFGHARGGEKSIGETPISMIEGIFTDGGGRKGATFRKALKFDRRNAAGYTCPVQLGGVNDPGDNIERQRGWALAFIKLAIKHRVPVRASTKGTTFRQPDYLRAFGAAPEQFWVAFSIISPDDDLIVRVDRGAPSATERLKTMKALSSIGVSTSLRFRPIFPGLSDATPRYPQAYRVLIEKAAEAGARAISYECGFYPSRIPKAKQQGWEDFSVLTGVPLRKVYSSFGHQACTRPSYAWTEEIMHAIKEVAVKCGMTVGVSDPTWKQLSDVGCCCGIAADDPVFGNWERENATQALINARDNPDHIVTVDEIIPPWAQDVPLGEMCNMGAGPLVTWEKRHGATWADKLRSVWNETQRERSPLNYFQGALQPVTLPNGDIGYRYVGLQRRHLTKTPYWHVC